MQTTVNPDFSRRSIAATQKIGAFSGQPSAFSKSKDTSDIKDSWAEETGIEINFYEKLMEVDG